MTIFELNIFGILVAPTYYGLMYAVGFIVGYLIIKKRNQLNKTLLDDLFLYIFLGVVLGGRLGYIIFYNYNYYINNILDIFKVWEGGMSFHGGVVGVVLAMIIFSKKYKINFYKIADQITLVLPIGLGLGRIGNYLNGELLGYSGYTGVFVVYKDGIGYFPSPLLEALLEGLILFLILNLVYHKYKKYVDGQIASLFLILYGIFRIFVELFFRKPDIQVGYVVGNISLGAILSMIMIFVGVVFYFYLDKKYEKS